MAEIFYIHPDNPQPRLISRVVDIINGGGVIVYPTDSAYALGCQLGNKTAMDKIRQLRKLDKHHNFTLVCRDLSELSQYAKVNNQVFRALKANTPGPYTFILEATSEVPRRLVHPKRKTIGIRVPANNIAQMLLTALNEPLMSVTLALPGDEYPLTDPEDIRQLLDNQVEAIVDGGHCGLEPTTIIDYTDDRPVLVRRGMGDTTPFGL